MMARRGGVTRSNMVLLIRGSSKGAGEMSSCGCGPSKWLGIGSTTDDEVISNNNIGIGKGNRGGRGVLDSSSSSSCFWVPHPRTGIYFPVGHEWVMEDVPDGAATFADTCCFRNN